MKTKLIFLIISLILFLGMACSKPDEYYKNLLGDSHKNYPGKLQNIESFEGYYRIKLKYALPPNASASKIVLAGATDTLYFDIPNNINNRLDSFIVDNLNETNYRFTVYTLNKANNPSIKQQLLFKVYGSRYKSSLSTLSVRSAGILPGTSDLNIVFYPDNANILVKSELKYINTNGETVILKKENPGENIILKNYKKGTDVYLSNGFLPKNNALDTVFTASKKITLP